MDRTVIVLQNEGDAEMEMQRIIPTVPTWMAVWTNKSLRG